MEDKIIRKTTQDDFVTEKVDIIKNNLLGFYDANNEYHIASPIIDELIAIEKLRKSSFGNSVFCVGNLLGYGEIVFEILYNTKTDNNSAQAYLFVLEDVNKINGYLQNTLRTQIAHFTSGVENFIEQSYQKFNVVGTLGDDGMEKKDLDEINLDDSYILAKKAYSLLLDKLCNEKMLDCYGKYFTARLSALTKIDNDFTNAVLANFNEEYTLIQGVFLQNKNYKTLNELLDKCFEEISGIKPEYVALEEEFNNAIKGDLDKFIESMCTINEKSENKAINLLDKADRNKIEEIQNEDGLTEKDLSSDEAIREYGEANAEAPKQTFESIEMEVSELFNKEEIMTDDDSDDGVEREIETDVEETLDEVDEESSEIELPFAELSNEEEEEELVSEEEESEIANLFDNAEVEEEVSLEEEQEIQSLFAEDTVSEQSDDLELEDDVEEVSVAESSSYDELDEESDALDREIEQISVSAKEHTEQVVEKPQEFTQYAEQSADINDIPTEDDLMSEEPLIEEIQEPVVERDEHDEHIDNLNNDYKENASMSIFDRLNRLNKNAKQDEKEDDYKEKQSPRDNKLDRLYNLLDKSMDR